MKIKDEITWFALTYIYTTNFDKKNCYNTGRKVASGGFPL